MARIFRPEDMEERNVPPQGMPQGMPPQTAPYPSGRPIPNAGAGALDAQPAVMQAMAVRDGAEEDAYNMGARDGARSLVDAALPDRTFAGGEITRAGITPEKLREAEKTLMKYKAGKASVERRIIHAQQWWKMRNWQEIEQERGTKGATSRKSNTAWLWNCIVGKHADALDSFPEPVILPRMIDDKEEAKRLSDIVPVVMEMVGFEEVYSDATWQKLQEGTGAYCVCWDKEKLDGMGDIAIRKVNLLNLFWEPGITDIQDSKNLFYVSFVDNDQLEGTYPQLKGKLKSTTLSIQKYTTDDSVPLDGKSAVVDWYYHTWQNGKKVLQYCQFVGETVLYSTENNGGEGLYDDGNYPFVLDPLYPVEGSPAGYGYIDIGRDAQMDIDTLSQAMVQNAVVASTPRFFLRKDGGVNETEFGDWSKPFIHVNGNLGEDSIRAVYTNPMTGNCISMLQQKIDELKFVTGNTDINNGGTPSGVTAASAIAALKEDAGRTSKDSTRSAYRAYRLIVTMVIERIRQFYDMPRQFRIIGQQGEEEFVSYDNSGIVPQPMQGGLGLESTMRLPVFDIEIHAQRENAYTRMSQNELALQFYQIGMFSPQQTDQALLAMDMMEFKGKEELAQKIRQQGTMQEALTNIGQVALSLADQYQPDLSEDILTLMQQALGHGAGMMGGEEAQNGTQLTGTGSAPDAQDSHAEKNEHPFVKAAKQRVDEAKRPD